MISLTNRIISSYWIYIFILNINRPHHLYSEAEPVLLLRCWCPIQDEIHIYQVHFSSLLFSSLLFSSLLFSSLLFSSLLFSSLLFSSLLFSSLLFSSLLSLALEGCEDERSGLETSREFFSSRSTALSREGVKSPLVLGLSAPLASPLVLGLSAPLASPLVRGLSAPLASPLVLGLSAPLASPPAHGHHDFTSTLRSSCPCLSVFMLDSVKSAGLGHLLILRYFVSFFFLVYVKRENNQTRKGLIVYCVYINHAQYLLLATLFLISTNAVLVLFLTYKGQWQVHAFRKLVFVFMLNVWPFA